MAPRKGCKEQKPKPKRWDVSYVLHKGGDLGIYDFFEAKDSQATLQSLNKDLQIQEPPITNLSISGSKMNRVGVTTLSSILKDMVPLLEELSLCNVAFPEGKKIFEALHNLKHLTRIDISFTNININDMYVLCKALRSIPVQYLSLCSVNIFVEKALPIFECLLPPSGIISLNISCNRITDYALQELAKVLPKSKLTYLNLSDNRKPELPSKVTSTKKFTSRNDPINPDGIEALCKAIPNSPLEELNISLNAPAFKGFDVRILAKCLQSSKLTELDISGNNIGHIAVMELFYIIPSSKLLHLSASHNGITAWSIIPYFQCFKYLVTLDLSYNYIEDNGLFWLVRGLGTDSKLEDLIVSSNNITDEGMQVLLNILPYTNNLRYVNISYNSITGRMNPPPTLSESKLESFVHST